jgi:uncharacterized damage-inducible protein DinB
MDALLLPLLESWDRQAEIIRNLSGLITEETRGFLPSPDGMALYRQLAHIHQVRKGWLESASPEIAEELEDAYFEKEGKWHPIEDLGQLKVMLANSDVAVRRAFEEAVKGGVAPMGPYDHPVYFLQHMIWHEGWHAGLIMLALRLNGHEPADAWEEKNLWGYWRTEEEWTG